MRRKRKSAEEIDIMVLQKWCDKEEEAVLNCWKGVLATIYADPHRIAQRLGEVIVHRGGSQSLEYKA